MKVVEFGQIVKIKEVVYIYFFDSGVNSSFIGGFSDVFKVLKYQKREMELYLDVELECLMSLNVICFFKCYGRGVFDLFVFVMEYIVGIYGQFCFVYGILVFILVVVSMIVMINNERMLKGKSFVGFINFVLY